VRAESGSLGGTLLEWLLFELSKNGARSRRLVETDLPPAMACIATGWDWACSGRVVPLSQDNADGLGDTVKANLAYNVIIVTYSEPTSMIAARFF
jgi:hypothetical protein